MAAIQTPSRLRPPGRLPEFFRVVAEEWSVFFDAVAHPRRLVEEVEQVHALLTEADLVEAVEPLRAAMLRRRAAHIGTR